MAISQSCILSFLITPPTFDATLPWAPNTGATIYFDFGAVHTNWEIISYDAGTTTWDILVGMYVSTYSLDGNGNLVDTTTSNVDANLTGINTIGPGEHSFGVKSVNGAVQLTVDGWDVSTVSGAPRHGAYTSYMLTGPPLANGKYAPAGISHPFPCQRTDIIAAGDAVPVDTGQLYPGSSAAFGNDNTGVIFYMNPDAEDPAGALANITLLYAQLDGAGFWTNRYLSTEA